MRVAARVVDPGEAEALGEAVGPLEVVEQRPDEVAAHVDAGVDGVEHGAQMAAEVGDPLRVPDLAVGVDVVVARHPVLEDVDRRGPYSSRSRSSSSVSAAGSISQSIAVRSELGAVHLDVLEVGAQRVVAEGHAAPSTPRPGPPSSGWARRPCGGA